MGGTFTFSFYTQTIKAGDKPMNDFAFTCAEVPLLTQANKMVNSVQFKMVSWYDLDTISL